MIQENQDKLSAAMTTIAAVSTPPGRGGIAVIRLSGQDAVAIASAFFKPRSGKSLTEAVSRFQTYGDILGPDGALIDNGLAAVFRAPSSYTGEDVVEISCHGGIVLTRDVLASAYAAGAVPAGPGEFTKRAFLSGKLSLTEAEAVIGLIDAESSEALRLSAHQARGTLSRKIETLTKEMTALLASLYAFIDYPDEDMTDMPLSELTERVKTLAASLRGLADTYQSGHAICEGVKTVLLGKPNAGKSSLLNALLGRERAIVTDIPGTTRDTVEETLVIGGALIRLCDTAGIRDPKDEVERLGTIRSGEMAQNAELLLGLFDASRPLDEDDEKVAALLSGAKEGSADVLLLLSKSDLDPEWDPAALKDFLPKPLQSCPVLPLSVRKEETVEELKKAVGELFSIGKLSPDTAMLSNARQYAAVRKAYDAVCDADRALSDGFPPDIAGLDLERALSLLGETDGRSVTEEIVSQIFSRFCVGK